MEAILFIFGLAVGSFLNVVSLRYKPDKFLLSGGIVGGRSRCPHCGKGLKWFELIPILSFVVQRGRCRGCGARLTLQYPIVEMLAGLVLVFVPLRLAALGLFPAANPVFFILAAAWILIFLGAILLSLIDIRLGIIPDELHVFFLILGATSLLVAPDFHMAARFYEWFPFPPAFFSLNPWLAHIIAAVIAALAFWFLVLITKGRGMGFGDVKLAGALGFLFGIPEIFVVIAVAFVAGALWGIGAMALGKKTMKSSLPFGPFLMFAALVVFFL